MDNQNTYVVFSHHVDHINNLQAAKDVAFNQFAVDFNLCLDLEEDIISAQEATEDYVTVTFNSPIDAETMEKLCNSIQSAYHGECCEFHKEIADQFNTDVTIVYPSERIAAMYAKIKRLADMYVKEH